MNLSGKDPLQEVAIKDHEEKEKQYEDAMKANKEAVDLVAGDNTKKKEGKVKNADLKKMHLSEDMFTDFFSPVNESMIKEESLNEGLKEEDAERLSDSIARSLERKLATAKTGENIYHLYDQLNGSQVDIEVKVTLPKINESLNEELYVDGWIAAILYTDNQAVLNVYEKFEDSDYEDYTVFADSKYYKDVDGFDTFMPLAGTITYITDGYGHPMSYDEVKQTLIDDEEQELFYVVRPDWELDESLKESFDTKDAISAIMNAYGYSKKEATEYMKKASDKQIEEIIKGFKSNAKKSFLTDSLKEGIDNSIDIEELAQKLDDFAWDYDPYEYNDSFDTREDGFQNAIDGIINNKEEIIKWLDETIEEAELGLEKEPGNQYDSWVVKDAKELRDMIMSYSVGNGVNEGLEDFDDEEINEDLLDDIAKKIVGNISMPEGLQKKINEEDEEEIDDSKYMPIKPVNKIEDEEGFSKSANDIANKIIEEYPKKLDDIYDIDVDTVNAYIKVSFLINNGDWKHDHLAFKYWMKENAEDMFPDFKVSYGGENRIGEEGKDVYTAVHEYYFEPIEEEEEFEEEPLEEPIEDDMEFEEPVNGEEDLFADEDFDEGDIFESLQGSIKFNIAKEQLKRFNEGKMPDDWSPRIYLENLVKRNHITRDEKNTLTEAFLNGK